MIGNILAELGHTNENDVLHHSENLLMEDVDESMQSIDMN